MTRKSINIVVPIYKEERNILPLYEAVLAVIDGLPEYEWEFVMVNDGSLDTSIDELRKLSNLDKRVCILDLSRNFGKEIALTAGVHEAEKADAVICMDADLQHPPYLIPRLLEEWEKGADVVATIRTGIERQPLLRRVGSHTYYWLMSRLSGLDMKSQTTDFRLYDKRVIQAFRHATERERMFRGIMDWMGFRKVYVEFYADARGFGDATYSYSKLIKLAINSITSFSLLPLRLTGYVGLIIFSVSGFLLFWMLINYILGSDRNYTPLAIVVVANTFLMGIVLMAIGLVALYIGIIHTEVINRPLYIIRERITANDNKSCV